jgi:hypothetical protein
MASDAAKLIAVVVLPTPPFWLAIAMALTIKKYYKSICYTEPEPVLTITTNFRELEENSSVSRETVSQRGYLE